MTAALSLGSAASMLRDAIKDKTYRSTPLGLEVARYIRWKRSEWGASPETISTYEPILARLAVFFADLQLNDLDGPVGVERIRECWDHHWGDLSPRTKQKVRAIWVDFFDWCVRERRGIVGNPARALAAPKLRGVRREPFGESFVLRVVGAQEYVGDRLGVILVLRYGLRRGELRHVQFRDFDFARRQLILTGKGGKVRVIPVVEEAFWTELATIELELGGTEVVRDRYLVCLRRTVGMRTTFMHYRKMSLSSTHRWWYNRLEEAGLVGARGSGTQQGLNMHRGRHTVASDILRRTGNLVAAQELLGHDSLETTRSAYASFDTEDLADVLRAIRGLDGD